MSRRVNLRKMLKKTSLTITEMALLRRELLFLDRTIYKIQHRRSKVELKLLVNSGGTNNSYRTLDRY